MLLAVFAINKLKKITTVIIIICLKSNMHNTLLYLCANIVSRGSGLNELGSVLFLEHPHGL